MFKKNLCKNKWKLAIIIGILLGITIFAITNTKNKNSTAINSNNLGMSSETQTNIATNSNATLYKSDAGQYLTADMGDSDEFYKPDSDKKIIFDFGQGNYDISNDIVKWSFGQPIVNLPAVAEEMGLTMQTEKPKGYVLHSRYEVYSPDDDPNTELRQSIFFVAPDGQFVRYTIGSRLIEDGNGNSVGMVYPCTLDGETLMVAASDLPYFDGKELKIGVPILYRYGDSKITLVAVPQDEENTTEEYIEDSNHETIVEEGDEINDTENAEEEFSSDFETSQTEPTTE